MKNKNPLLLTTMKHSKSLKLFLGNLQAECLEMLWDKKRATVKDIWEVFKKRGREYAYTTILTEMQNLEKKGLVKSEKSGKQNIYYPVYTKEEFLSRKFEEIISPLIEEYPELVTSHFLKSVKLSKKEKIMEILKRKK
jgi:predicted transcriptional regulator